MLLFLEFVGELLEEMLLATKVLRHNAKNIDIAVETVGFKSKTAK
jgi:hypothetical protein